MEQQQVEQQQQQVEQEQQQQQVEQQQIEAARMTAAADKSAEVQMDQQVQTVAQMDQQVEQMAQQRRRGSSRWCKTSEVRGSGETKLLASLQVPYRLRQHSEAVGIL